MPSSKGKPTDPKLREEAKNEVKNMEKGGGKGAWSAYKAAEMAKVYEKKGGGYEDTGKNPNAAEKGDPKPKKEAVESGERKSKDAPVGAKKESTTNKKKATSTQKSGGEEGKKTKSSAQKTKKEPAKGTREQPKRSKKK